MTGPDKRTFHVLSFGPVRGFVLVFVSVVSFVSTSCVRSVTEAECQSLAKHVHEVWTAEAKYPPTGSPTAEKAVAVIKSEGQQLEEFVFATCKRDYVGKPKASGEFSCLARASTYADVQACGTIPEH